MSKISAHFTSEEFACPHCNRSFVDPKLLEGLEKLRTKAGHPVHVLSGYRCALHNKKVGGASNSMHIAGKAADIQVDQLDAFALLHMITSNSPDFGFTGIGFYPDRNEMFVHVDTRPGPLATWARIGNKYVSLAEGVKLWKKANTTSTIS